jgi:cobyric acid synthase
MINPFLPRGVTLIAPSSGTGKTAVAVGIARALHRQDIAVDPFKATSVVDLTDRSSRPLKVHERGVFHNCAAAGVPVRWWNNPVVAVRSGNGRGQLYVRGEALGEVPIFGQDSLDLRVFPPDLRTRCLDAVTQALAILAERGSFVVIEGSGGAGNLPARADLANDVVPLRAGLPVVLVGNVNQEGHLTSLPGLTEVMGEPYRRLMVGYVLNGVRDSARLADARERLAQAMPIPELAAVPSYIPSDGYEDSPQACELVYDKRADHVASRALLAAISCLDTAFRRVPSDPPLSLCR